MDVNEKLFVWTLHSTSMDDVYGETRVDYEGHWIVSAKRGLLLGVWVGLPKCCKDLNLKIVKKLLSLEVKCW